MPNEMQVKNLYAFKKVLISTFIEKYGYDYAKQLKPVIEETLEEFIQPKKEGEV